MADNHEEHEGPIHQAPWVFYLTVAICYAVVTLIMGAKYAVGDVEFGEIAKLYIVEIGLMTAFLLFFGSLIYFVNKLLGATSAKE